MSKIEVIRKEETEKATFGQLTIKGEQQPEIHTLEQPWKYNRNGESCIPPGEYDYYIRDASTSRWNYDPIQLEGVFGRSAIQIHKGNYPADTRGCILPGLGRGGNAVWSSGDAYDLIMSKIEDTGIVVVKYDSDFSNLRG